jgi:hypothetical protein
MFLSFLFILHEFINLDEDHLFYIILIISPLTEKISILLRESFQYLNDDVS